MRFNLFKRDFTSVRTLYRFKREKYLRAIISNSLDLLMEEKKTLEKIPLAYFQNADKAVKELKKGEKNANGIQRNRQK